jgi:hypothetical protein
VYYFTVIARGTNGTRSACAGELILGKPDGCRVESCCPGQPCTLDDAPDGTPCDDANACRVCRAASCATTAESALETRRLRLASQTAAPRVSAVGTFIPAEPLDPTADGVTVSVFDALGTVVLTAVVPPDALMPGGAGKSFVLARDRRDGPVAMLSLRIRNGAATVRARLTTDPGSPTGPLGWAVASGGSCGRSAALTCSTTVRGLSCR